MNRLKMNKRRTGYARQRLWRCLSGKTVPTADGLRAIALYEAGMSLNEIAFMIEQSYGMPIHREAVRQALKRLGVQLRTRRDHGKQRDAYGRYVA